MPETVGMLELKIARLEQRLAVIRQQQRLSQPYPEHRAALLSQARHLQAVLAQLNWRRQEVGPARQAA